MNLANRLLNNPGLIALTVKDEQDELLAVTKVHTRKIKFAFFQRDLQGNRIPFWHVNWNMHSNGSESFGTTLSMEGLRRWKYV